MHIYIERDIGLYVYMFMYIDVHLTYICICFTSFQLCLCFMACRGCHSHVEHIHVGHTIGHGALAQLRCCTQIMIKQGKIWEPVPISISRFVSVPAVSHGTFCRLDSCALGNTISFCHLWNCNHCMISDRIVVPHLSQGFCA